MIRSVGRAICGAGLFILGMSFAFALIDNSHGQPYPDRLLVVVGTVVMWAGIWLEIR